MNPTLDNRMAVTRRTFFNRAGIGLGIPALAQLLSRDLLAAGGLTGLPHFPPKAKRVIYLFQGGGPSQLDTFDYKPLLKERQGIDLPASVRNGQRLTTQTSGQESFPTVPSAFNFAQYGKSGAWVSNLLPHTAKVVDDLCFIKSMYTEQINHDPAVTFAQTGFQLAGRPSIGAWVTYGLGSENDNLPAFVVLVTGSGQDIAQRDWGAGFLPSKYQGVQLRSVGEPVLYISDPEGFKGEHRDRFITALDGMNRHELKDVQDPEISTRISQYEMAFRMQQSVPELTDFSKEPDSTFELYGPDSKKRGTFAFNCLMARRLAERGVRFIQLYHRAWDHHRNLPREIRAACSETDQPCAALIQDLKQRGLLEDTLVIWAGEFGRTVYCQGKMTADNYGRDHHGRCFTVWMAGAGVKPGYTLGQTDEYSYNVIEDPVHIHDLNATVLHSLGIDHTRLTFKYQGRNFRLTDVYGTVVKKILA